MMLDVLPEAQHRNWDDTQKILGKFDLYRYGASTPVRTTHRRYYAPVAGLVIEPATTIAILNLDPDDLVQFSFDFNPVGPAFTQQVVISPKMWVLFPNIDGVYQNLVTSLGASDILIEMIRVWNYDLVDPQ